MTEYPLLSGHCWGVTVQVGGRPVRLRVLGDSPPSEATLKALREIAETVARREGDRD